MYKFKYHANNSHKIYGIKMYVAYLFILKNFIIVNTVKIITKDISNKASLIFFCLKKKCIIVNKITSNGKMILSLFPKFIIKF